MSILHLAVKSLSNRKTTALLTIFSIAISVALLLGVERVRVEARNSLPVPYPVPILWSVPAAVRLACCSIRCFIWVMQPITSLGKPISTCPPIRRSPGLSPIALGDSHQGYRVVGTVQTLFQHFRFGDDQPINFSNGKPFGDLYDAVIGSEVAAVLGYQVGQEIVLSHGVESRSLQTHQDKPFRISGVLKPTGTPMDRVVMISLEGIEALHIDWVNGAAPNALFSVSADRARAMDLQPSSITAYFVGLKSRVAAFRYQRVVNEYRQEALTAILPGVALGELWQLVGSAEKALLAVSVMVVIAGLVGMLTTILTSLNERRREMAILRSVGARPGHIFTLMMTESLILCHHWHAIGFPADVWNAVRHSTGIANAAGFAYYHCVSGAF